jgi:hypothetical protein
VFLRQKRKFQVTDLGRIRERERVREREVEGDKENL